MCWVGRGLSWELNFDHSIFSLINPTLFFSYPQNTSQTPSIYQQLRKSTTMATATLPRPTTTKPTSILKNSGRDSPPRVRFNPEPLGPTPAGQPDTTPPLPPPRGRSEVMSTRRTRETSYSRSPSRSLSRDRHSNYRRDDYDYEYPSEDERTRTVRREREDTRSSSGKTSLLTGLATLAAAAVLPGALIASASGHSHSSSHSSSRSVRSRGKNYNYGGSGGGSGSGYGRTGGGGSGYGRTGSYTSSNGSGSSSGYRSSGSSRAGSYVGSGSAVYGTKKIVERVDTYVSSGSGYGKVHGARRDVVYGRGW